MQKLNKKVHNRRYLPCLQELVTFTHVYRVTEQFAGAYFVRQDRFEAPAEVAEVIPVFMDLHPLTIVFNLCIHAIGALLHGILY